MQFYRRKRERPEGGLISARLVSAASARRVRVAYERREECVIPSSLAKPGRARDDRRLLLVGLRDRLKEVRADQLVASIVLRTFLSIFPLLLVAIAVLGFVAAHSHGKQDLATRLVDNLKLSGGLADTVKENLAAARRSRKAASVVGGLSLVFSGLGVFTAIAKSCDTVWQVPGRGLKDRLLGVVWLIGAVFSIAGSAAALALVRVIPVPVLGAVAGVGAGGVCATLLFGWTQAVFTNIRVPVRTFVPGAVLGGVGLSLFQLFGSVLVAQLLKNASQLYASLAAVVALIGLLSVFAWLLVVSVTVNVLLWEREHGTVSLAVLAPAVPPAVWVMTGRGGQRLKR